MRLVPREIDKLLLRQSGVLAQQRLSRGLRLNYPEACALISTVCLELIRDGKHTVSELMSKGRTILGFDHVMPAVPFMLSEVQVEGTFRDGTKLLTIHSPISTSCGDLELALYGSGLDVPKGLQFPKAEFEDVAIPGSYILKDRDIMLNDGRERVVLSVSNKGDRPIQVSLLQNSHIFIRAITVSALFY